jgi:hypothetical protein
MGKWTAAEIGNRSALEPHKPMGAAKPFATSMCMDGNISLFDLIWMQVPMTKFFLS